MKKGSLFQQRNAFASIHSLESPIPAPQTHSAFHRRVETAQHFIGELVYAAEKSHMKAKLAPNISTVTSFLLFVWTVAIPASADIITVTNTNDNGPGSLRQALADANDGDTIEFAVTGTIGLTSGELVVDKSLTISGPGADSLAVNGSAKSRVFYVGPDAILTISQLSITNGNATTDFGGGIYNDQSTLTLNNCELTGNSADFGGGIYTAGSLSGGATVILNNSTCNYNAAIEGAAIFNAGDQSGAEVTLNNCSFSGNSASNPGGGIYNFGEMGDATVTLNNSTFSGNSAGNNGNGDGGGIYNDGTAGNATLMISDCTFSGNSTSGGGGGGIASFGGGFGSATLTVSNSTFSGNSSIVVGGAIYNDGENGSATLTIGNSTFAGNVADAAGDSIYDEGENGSAPVSFTNTIFKASNSGNFFNNGGTITSLGYNLSNDDGSGFLTGPGDQINTDPILGPLQDNGGPTLTHALSKGSPAIDAGDPGFTPPPFFDQRGAGFERVVNGFIDIGSFEVQTGATPTPTPTATAAATATPTPTPCEGRCSPTPRPRPTPAPRP